MSTKSVTFRKTECKVTLDERNIVTLIKVKGKNTVRGSYPNDYKDKKKYLITLLKKATL